MLIKIQYYSTTSNDAYPSLPPIHPPELEIHRCYGGGAELELSEDKIDVKITEFLSYTIFRFH